MIQMRVIRIDWRLVHANTIDYWVRPLNLHGIVLCDSAVAADPLKQIGYRMFCPSDFQLQIIPLDAVERTDWSGSLLLFRDIESLMRSGITLNSGDILAISPHQPLSEEGTLFLSEAACSGIHTTFDTVYQAFESC